MSTGCDPYGPRAMGEPPVRVSDIIRRLSQDEMHSMVARSPFRPAEADRSWLLEYAEQTGQPVNAILREALAAYRDSHTPFRSVPPFSLAPYGSWDSEVVRLLLTATDEGGIPDA